MKLTVTHADTTVDVQVACADPDTPDPARMQTWVAATLAAAGFDHDAGAEVSVRVVDAEEIQALNAAYRQQDKPTNVLSFPTDTLALPAGQPQLLGDVVICAPVVRAEAEGQGKQLAAHWAHMLVHGTLHLLGYDHETDAEAARMEALETSILAAHGFANPYASQ